MVRLRHRYVIMDIETADNGTKTEASKLSQLIRPNSFVEWIMKAIRKLHGIQGVAFAKAGLMVKYISSTSLVYIRMRHSSYKIVMSSLPFVTHIEGTAVTIKTIHTAATIRHCNIFLKKYYRQELRQKYADLKSDYQKNLFEIELGKLIIPEIR